jgi:uncharacterized protein (DUF1800 family)
MRRLIAALLLVALAACGGGGGGGGGSGGGGTVPPAAAVTDAEAGRLLSQASFGATEASINTVKSAGLNGWISQQLTIGPPSSGIQAYLDTRLAQLQTTNPTASLNANHFYEGWWRAATQEQGELRQRVAFAYSQIFVISLADGAVDVRGAGSYYDMLNRNAFGNFRTLLEDITLHPMMGRYLTYLANQKEDTAGTRTPDENYAREVMQLFTLGVNRLNANGTTQTDSSGAAIPSYTPADISGLAKVFTGISWYHPNPTNSTFFGGNRDPDREVRPMIFYPQYHSTSAKTFLGVTIAASPTVDVAGDLRIALDTLYNHPNVGPFLAQRLIQQLVTSNPSPAYVGRVTAVFNNNGSGVRGDMGAVVRAILTDAEARDMNNLNSTSFGKLREPVIRMTHWMRAFGATSQTGNWLITSTSSNQSLGQSPLASPSVFNFWRPGFVPPATTELGSRNLLAPEFQIVDEVSVAGYLNTIQTTIDAGIGSTPPGGSGRDVRSAYTAEIALAENPTALVDRINLLLLSNSASAALRAQITDAVNAITIPSGTSVTQAQIDAARLNRVKTAILFAMASPEYLIQR